MFIDLATIMVRAGKGGDGCVSFRREKFVPKGGPNGGDGGNGGDVILLGDPGMNSLIWFTRQPHHRAQHGAPGMGSSKHGRSGGDCVVPVPLGTVVRDHETREIIADIDQPGQRFIAARGGRGGFGNEHFKSSTNQAPRQATPGEPGEERTLRLELKVIADVGLIGRPNAGKSTLLRAISRAKPKVADYPFTTLSPHLGIAELSGERRLVVADIPGLIEGAAEGAGLGHDFLRHVERTKVLVHVVDVAPIDGTHAAANYHAVRSELQKYSDELARKPEIIAFNKIDLISESEREHCFTRLAEQVPPACEFAAVRISGVTGEGITEMLEACWAAREMAHATGSAPPV